MQNMQLHVCLLLLFVHETWTDEICVKRDV